jgi:hypothetical protein
MSLPLIFKHGNPGCPCCGQRLIGHVDDGDDDYEDGTSVCACYPFDDHANNVVFDGLHLASTYPSYATGKLDNATKHTGTQHHEHPHHTCYVPEQASSPTSPLFGINVWFWIKRAKPPSQASPPNKIEYVISKGEWATTNKGYFQPPNSDAAGFNGTWSIFIDPTVSDNPSLHDIYFAVAYEDGHTDVMCFSDSWEDPTDWVFFFWWYEPTAGLAGTHTGRYSLVRNGVTIYDEVTVAIGDAANPMRQTDPEKLIVGKNLGAHLYETILIDNVGFSRRIETKAEMTARAAALYNSGTGIACPASGG